MTLASDSWLDSVSDVPPAPIERTGLDEEKYAPRKTWMMEEGCGRDRDHARGLFPSWPRPHPDPLCSADRQPPFKCNHCCARITGVRYECMDCEDYDLCAACDALLDTGKEPFHPAQHPFKKWPHS